MAHADDNQVTPFLYLSPILAAGLSWIMFHQIPGWPVWIGGLFVLTGVILVQRYGKQRGPLLEDLSA
jgi:drug/metabolite transporter (DMT)-like permease